MQDWLLTQPGLSLAQVKRAVADQYGLLVSEVNAKLRRVEGVYRAAKLEAQAASVLRAAGLKRDEGSS